MKFIAALRLVLLGFLLDPTGPVCAEVLPYIAKCPGSSFAYCAEWHTRLNNFEICYFTFEKVVTAMEAAEICQKEGRELIDLRTPAELDIPGREILLRNQNRTFWLMPVENDKRYDINADTLCPVLTTNNVTKIPCGMKQTFICQDGRAYAGGEPVISVKARGRFDDRLLYKGALVTIGCSVIRSRKAQLEIQVNDRFGRTTIFKNNNMTIFTDKTPCGVLTAAYIEQSLHLQVRRIACFTQGVQELDCYADYTEKTGYKYRNSCKVELFLLVDGDLGLQLFVKFHGRPNIVLNQKELLAFCFSKQYDYRHFKFAVVVDGKVQKLMDSNAVFNYSEHAFYINGRTAAVLKLKPSDECLGGKQFELVCYDKKRTVGTFVECRNDVLTCYSNRVIVDNSPLVEVKGKAFRQDTLLYENSTVIITCSYIRPSEFQPVVHLSDSPVYSRSFKGEDLNVAMEQVKCGVRTSATLELVLNRSLDLMKKFVTCTIGNAEFTSCDNEAGCGQKGPFEYQSAPKVELKVKNFKGPIIVANCTSFGFKTVWAMNDKETLNVLSKHDLGVKIEEMEVPEEKAWISNLSVQIKSRNLTGETVTLGCYIESIYADQVECLEFDFWCDTILLKIDSDDEDGITFMKIGVVVLASLLPLVLILVCCMVFKLCPCRKKTQAVPVAGVSSSVQAGTDGLEKSLASKSSSRNN